MIIDCHVHPWAPTDQILAAAARNRIDRLCFFTVATTVGQSLPEDWWNPPAERVRRHNDEILGILKAYPERTCGLCFVNPNNPEHCAEEIRRCVVEGPMLGIKLWVSAKASSPEVFRVAELAGEAGVPVLQHCWNKTTGNLPHETNTRELAALARAFPEVTILAAHIHGHGEAGILDLEPYPNVLVDTSGGESDRGILEFALRRLGSKRILYGSDAPGRDFAPALARVYGCPMTDEERADILHRNFEQHFLNRPVAKN
jgi:uncharacterized protein